MLERFWFRATAWLWKWSLFASNSPKLFLFPSGYRYVLFDHDAKFGGEVFRFLKSSDLKPMQISIRSPWRNGIAERFVSSIRGSFSIM
jgi:hypothetical protein